MPLAPRVQLVRAGVEDGRHAGCRLVQEQLGGFLRLSPGAGSYTPIEIVAALPPASEHPDTLAAREALMRFLAGAKAQELLRRAGL